MPVVGSARVRSLDGLRAIAVTAVIGFHLGVGWLSGGLLGVDMFFVLSGFLITGLLVTERDRTGRISLKGFYSRRARRLLPAMLLVLIVTLVVWRLTADPSRFPGLRGDATATLGYVANWHFAFSGQGYFDQLAPPSPLLHLWSLAVEEQFYPGVAAGSDHHTAVREQAPPARRRHGRRGGEHSSDQRAQRPRG